MRATSACVIGAALFALTACGTAKDEAPAAPPAAGGAVKSAPAEAGNRTAKNDKQLCESVEKYGQEMKKAVLAELSSGKAPTDAAIQKAMTDMAAKVAGLTAAGGSGKVIDALNQLGSESAKAAALKDPKGIENAGFEKAATDLTTACQGAGVKINF